MGDFAPVDPLAFNSPLAANNLDTPSVKVFKLNLLTDS